MSRPRRPPGSRSRSGYSRERRSMFETLPCPLCEADAGTPCITASGNRTYPHLQRVEDCKAAAGCNGRPAETATSSEKTRAETIARLESVTAGAA